MAFGGAVQSGVGGGMNGVTSSGGAVGAAGGAKATDGIPSLIAPILFPESPLLTPAERALNDLALGGYARAANICKCVPPSIGCIDAEGVQISYILASWAQRGSLDSRRCTLALVEATPGLADALHCEASRLNELAACEQVDCGSSGVSIKSCMSVPTITCNLLPDEQNDALRSCRTAYFCGDVRRDEYRCNGTYECPDHSDEYRCPGTWLDCNDGLHTASVPFELCNGVRQCSNGLDESFCASSPIGLESTFDCGDGKSMLPGVVCDGKPDCANGRDESFTCYRK